MRPGRGWTVASGRHDRRHQHRQLDRRHRQLDGGDRLDGQLDGRNWQLDRRHQLDGRNHWRSSTAGTTGSSTAGTTGSSTAGTTGSSTAGTTGSSTAGTTGSSTAGSTGGTTGSSALDITGTYQVTTSYNLEQALPTDVGNGLNLVLELSANPGAFLLDDVAGQIPVIKYVVDAIDLFSGVRNSIITDINNDLNTWSDGLVSTLMTLSNDITNALMGLKAKNTIVIVAAPGGGYTVTDTLTALTFTYQTDEHDYAQGATATTTATYSGLKLVIAGHTYNQGVRIGTILLDLIDNVALPDLTGVNSLGALMNQLVDCGGLADTIWGDIGGVCLTSDTSTCLDSYISANDIAKLCTEALDLAGTLIENKVSALDGPGMMSMSDGNCLALEQKGHTGKADTLMSGTWSLTIPAGVGNITLPGTFVGTK